MRVLALIALSVFAASVMSAPVPKVKAGDKEAILGTWKEVTFDIGEGRLLKTGTVYVFETDGVLRAFNDSDKTEEKWRYKIDPTAEVKTIDLTAPDGNDQAKTLPGIYELDGDTLKICTQTGPNLGRPKELKSGTAWAPLSTFKRVKEETKGK